MTDRPTVDITGLTKAEVLAALFNATAPGGMGFLQAVSGPKVMTIEDAEEILASSMTYFDYVYGRCLKLDLSQDNSFDPWGFDRENGQGAAQKVIDRLRATKDTNPPESQEAHNAALQTNADKTRELANTPSSSSGGIYYLGGDDVAVPLRAAVDSELSRSDD